MHGACERRARVALSQRRVLGGTLPLLVCNSCLCNSSSPLPLSCYVCATPAPVKSTSVCPERAVPQLDVSPVVCLKHARASPAPQLAPFLHIPVGQDRVSSYGQQRRGKCDAVVPALRQMGRPRRAFPKLCPYVAGEDPSLPTPLHPCVRCSSLRPASHLP